MILARPHTISWDPTTIKMFYKIDCSKTFPNSIESSLRLHTSPKTCMQPLADPYTPQYFRNMYKSWLNHYVPFTFIMMSIIRIKIHTLIRKLMLYYKNYKFLITSSIINISFISLKPCLPCKRTAAFKALLAKIRIEYAS